jgi:hypothetical protein
MKILIANDKGGVGKSTLAQFCVIAARGAGLAPRIVEYDRQPRLGRLFPEAPVQSRGLGPSPSQAGARPDEALRFWDPMADWMRDPTATVVDFGAQAWAGFTDWAGASRFPQLWRGDGACVLVPVTADLEAIRAALRVVEDAATLLPDARLLVLTLDKDGAVDLLQDLPDFRRLVRLAGQCAGGAVRPLSVIRAEAWPLLTAHGIRLDQAVAGRADVLAGLGLSDVVRARTVAALRAWMHDTYRILLPLLLSAAVAAPAPSRVRPHGRTMAQPPAPPWTLDARTVAATSPLRAARRHLGQPMGEDSLSAAASGQTGRHAAGAWTGDPVACRGRT